MVFGIIPECRSDSLRNKRSASPESPIPKISSCTILHKARVAGLKIVAALVAAFCFLCQPRSSRLLLLLARDCKKEGQMGILESATPTIVICTRDRVRATGFYRETLGLILAREDKFAAVFNTGGVTLRVSLVADFTPHEHTMLGFQVTDVKATVIALCEKGVAFNIYPGFNQDELGILALPGGMGLVAWFKDPDGNVLSVTDV
jgi:hypothetical protein